VSGKGKNRFGFSNDFGSFDAFHTFDDGSVHADNTFGPSDFSSDDSNGSSYGNNRHAAWNSESSF